MLFLAVFCGFLAENKREHMVEHQRAKVYAANLYEELKKDTATIGSTIINNEYVSAKLDSFCLFSTKKNDVSNSKLYFYSSFVTSTNFFSSNNTTIEQMKGSGNLRILGNELSQKIGEYGKILSMLENDYHLQRPEFEKMESLYFKIFDGYTGGLLFPVGNREQNKDSAFRLSLSLINDDIKLMKEFRGWVKFEAEIYIFQNNTFLKPLKQKATELLVLLKKKYHLK